MSLNIKRFLKVSKCPSCSRKMLYNHDAFSCSYCNNIFSFNVDGIPIFFNRSDSVKSLDKYEDKLFVDRYAGLLAYGYLNYERGQMESLHRTVSEFILSTVISNDVECILDVGCGPGRALHTCGKHLKNSFIVGVDLSEAMLKVAKKILLCDEKVHFNLTPQGFSNSELQGFNYNNIFLIQGNAEKLPLKENSFDMVISVNLIDRTDNPLFCVKSICSVLKPGGFFIFSSPLNWQNKDHWTIYPDKGSVCKLFKDCGLQIIEFFDGLIYREALDYRGSYSDFNTIFIKAIKV